MDKNLSSCKMQTAFKQSIVASINDHNVNIFFSQNSIRKNYPANFRIKFVFYSLTEYQPVFGYMANRWHLPNQILSNTSNIRRCSKIRTWFLFASKNFREWHLERTIFVHVYLCVCVCFIFRSFERRCGVVKFGGGSSFRSFVL